MFYHDLLINLIILHFFSIFIPSLIFNSAAGMAVHSSIDVPTTCLRTLFHCVYTLLRDFNVMFYAQWKI